MAKLVSIESIGPVNARKLQKVGVRSTNSLLKMGATPGGRRELAAQSGFSSSTILKWVNRADLMRIKGVGEEFSDLLEAGGVDTVVELGQRNPASLYQQLGKTNSAKKLVRRLPSAKQVADWVWQAKKLPRKVNY